ncbi:putative transcription factor MYB-HB-like family [Helianthus debilis subsp. tardiflorus]
MRFRKFFLEELPLSCFFSHYRIKFLLCDYGRFPKTCKFDRITSCEILEAVGHEYMEAFFGCSELALANFRPARGTPYRPLQLSATPSYSAGPIIGNEAVPKRILDLMNVEGLIRGNVASHLQLHLSFTKIAIFGHYILYFCKYTEILYHSK